MDEKEKKLAHYRMNQSEEALRSAKALLDMSDYRGAINRFYYSAFYATQALLMQKGKEARTHSGNLHLFREEYIKTGIFPQETNQVLSDLFEVRLEGDYGFPDEPDRHEADLAQQNCEEFVSQAKKVFQKGASPKKLPKQP
ncbi:MAG: HEPN domain-containing protein [Deltaproteobacteria bacterium]|nr:HEPN domain-containing protein [Deltaproteobacteria bacterium]